MRLRIVAMAVALGLVATTACAVEITRTEVTHTRTVDLGGRLPLSVRLFTAPGAEVGASDDVLATLQNAKVQVEIHPVDELARAEAAINASLPKDMEEAERVMKKRIADGMALDQEIQRGWMHVLMVRQLQIHTVPAIVFDESQVVYGETDLGTALAHYQAFKETER